MSNSNGTLTLVPPPLGYVVDFTNPKRQLVTQVYTVVVVENLLAMAFLLQRIYTRTVLMKSFQLEDAVVITAWLFSIGTQATLLVGWHVGVMGVHAWEISLDDYGRYSRLIFAAPLVYAPCMAFAKAALCLFYSRLNPNHIYQVAIRITLFLDIGAYTGIFFSLIFACSPIAASWSPLLEPTSICINRGAIYIATAVIGVVTDALLIIIPIPTVWGLHMPRKQKIGLTSIFGVGSITMVTSIIRLKVLIPALTSIDQPWVIGEGTLWIFIEANLLIICCCLPTLRRFFKHFAPRFIGEYPETSSQANGSGRKVRTWGGATSRPKRQFDTLMNTIDESDNKKDISLDRRGEGTIHGGRDARLMRLNATCMRYDNDSEEAILYVVDECDQFRDSRCNDIAL